MKQSKLLILVLAIFIITNIQHVQAQGTITVNGKVVDETGMEMPGTTIVVKGTTNGTITDIDGNYTLSDVPSDGTLIFSSVGLATQEIEVNNQTAVNVTMVEDTELLEEVVVVGYGTTKKRDLTGSISRLKSEDIVSQPALTATQSIQGKTSGIQVIGSGEPGTTPTIRIRGTGTAEGGRNPLYVVDGIITGRIDNINSADILTMDVLKDASSLAIYGNRGANGVVIITTKKGKGEKMQVEYNGYAGIKDVMKKVKMANADQFIDYTNDAFAADFPDGRFTKPPANNTDWFDEITRQGFVSDHNVSLSGAGEKVNYFFSAGYFVENGILERNDYNRVTVRNNMDYKISEKIKIGSSISVSYANKTLKPLSVFNLAYRQSPLVPVKYKTDNPWAGRDGQPIDDYGRYNNGGNPVADIDLTFNRAKEFVFQGAVTGEYKIFEFLKFNTSLALEKANYRGRNYIPNRERFLASDPSQQVSDYDTDDDPINTLEITRDNNYHWTWDNYFTFEKIFEEIHNVKATLGTTTENLRAKDRLFERGLNVPEDTKYWNLFNAETISTKPEEAHEKDPERNLRSYFARANYSYDNKYLLTATIRTDGSGQFQKGKQWGYFPAVGLGWVISEESFMEDNGIVDFLKLRGSWGRLANQTIPLNILIVTTGLDYPFGPNDGTRNPGAIITDIIDPDVSWEITEEFDAGIEFSMLNNRLTGEIDYYNRLNENAILGIELPGILGAGNRPFTHAAEIQNTGWEFSIGWKDELNENLDYYVNGNLTLNKNELKKITNDYAIRKRGGGTGNGQVTKLMEVGQPIGSFWLWEVTGVDENGEFIYKDVDGDGNTSNDEDDRQFFGSYQPKLYYGISAGMEYKNFDFSIDAYGNAGNKVYNGKKAQRWGGENIEADIAVNRWTPENTNTGEPAAMNNVPVASTYYLESGSFFRINNITLGYTLNEPLNIVKKVRIYLSAQNPFISQKFSGFTSELQGDGDPMGSEGMELNAYPTNKSYLVGLSVNF